MRVRLVISGRVQGVGYRANAARKAEALGLTGWVKNLPDGRVETLAEGAEDIVNEFIAWCRRGPTAARVTTVDVVLREEAPAEFAVFEIAF
ncbi:MAG TPA: acylphosphatase [bacterium]|nr:acylphosphatase [bacterium]